jgi:hypothetical protein
MAGMTVSDTWSEMLLSDLRAGDVSTMLEYEWRPADMAC